MKKTRLIALAMAVLMLLCAVVGCQSKESTVKEGCLTVGTNAAFPPFEYLGDNGEADGFDVALMKAIAKEVGLEFKLEDMEFNSLIAAVQSKQIDCVAAGLTVKPDRLEAVSFSDTYYTATQKVIVKTDSEIASNDDLKNKKIAVQEATTGDYTCDEIEGCEVVRFKKGVDAVMDLVNGNVDCVIIDSNPAAVFVSQNEGLKIVDDCTFPPEHYAIAVSPAQQELLKKINAALAKFKEDGTYDELVKQYINN